MKAYKVTYQTYGVSHGAMRLLSDNSYDIYAKEVFFSTKEKAEEFAKRKNEASKELGLPLSATVQEVELE